MVGVDRPLGEIEPDALTWRPKPIHARQTWTAAALCGDPGPSLWTTQRCAVTCLGCVAEIERRLSDPGWNGGPARTSNRPAERTPGAFRSGALIRAGAAVG